MSFTRLVHDRSGAIAPLFALTLVAIVGITGAAVDYSGAASLRTRLQKATDGADLLLYRPRFVRHRIACYAARAADESWLWRMAAGVWNPCRSMSQVVL